MKQHTLKSVDIDHRLLASHIADNADFETACVTGDAEQIRSIVISEMEKSGLQTKGAKKLRDDIFSRLQGKSSVSTNIGQQLLAFVWNSRLSGTGLAVVK